ncbi:peptidoglycan-associated lipoprotein [Alkalispirillum mobile]|uniref:Peptidoglycan-associated lipoprotein n=1 Tax=Alkalispirillum mobile TaxID=85925 RepID=A0A498C6Z8_9GAMM|nr:peptidoglycan-associated lipoprotein Pal [Alkalispirillum mobile]RLK51512.1 peptidoglycan-associated lipoprotein [Alkalispirillum mobile]
MKKLHTWLVLAVAGLFLSACATVSDVETDERRADRDRDRTAEADWSERRLDEARARGLDPDDPFISALMDDPEGPLAQQTVYFDFDRSEIRDEDMPVIEAHARFLTENSSRRMTIEGHTDERGSREYNLALGERRAESVKRVMVLNGVDEDQLEIVSYGEENPVALGSDEDAWEQNRRAELIYRQ